MQKRLGIFKNAKGAFPNIISILLLYLKTTRYNNRSKIGPELRRFFLKGTYYDLTNKI